MSSVARDARGFGGENVARAGNSDAGDSARWAHTAVFASAGARVVESLLPVYGLRRATGATSLSGVCRFVTPVDGPPRRRPAGCRRRCRQRCRHSSTGGRRVRDRSPRKAHDNAHESGHRKNKRRHAKTRNALCLDSLVGSIGLEPTTPTMSRWCSNQLSYEPRKTASIGSIFGAGKSFAGKSGKKSSAASLAALGRAATRLEPHPDALVAPAPRALLHVEQADGGDQIA